MIDRVLIDWQIKNGLTLTGDHIYGVFNNVGFTVFKENNGKLFVISVNVNESMRALKELQGVFKRADGILGNIKVGTVDDYLALFLSDECSPVTVSDYDKIIEFAVNNIHSLGIDINNRCFSCSSTATTVIYDQGMVKPVCGRCFAHLNDSEVSGLCESGISVSPYLSPDAEKTEQQEPSPVVPEQKNAEPLKDSDLDALEFDWNESGTENKKTVSQSADIFDSDNYVVGSNTNIPDELFADSSEAMRLERTYRIRGSYITGILGALVGACMGGGLIYAGFWYFENLYALLAVFSGVFAPLIYMLLAGKRKKGFSVTVSIVFSVIVSLAAVYCVSALISLDDSFVFNFSWDDDSFKQLVMNEAIALISSLIGVLTLTGALKKYCDKN